MRMTRIGKTGDDLLMGQDGVVYNNAGEVVHDRAAPVVEEITLENVPAPPEMIDADPQLCEQP